MSKIRNIGIIAHIDAGKTTTTERMLFYAGEVGLPGEVHDGNTVMDYMQQERNRGITIRAASTSFLWDGHQVNLIDTPGHVDFTGEVERALRVADGAICILDSIEGVETQSETVWAQAQKYKIPRLVFLNKLDKEGATLDDALDSLKSTLGAKPILLNAPTAEGKALDGLVDLLNLEKIDWIDPLGTRVQRAPLSPSDPLFEQMKSRREAMLQQLANYSDTLAEAYLAEQQISAELINSSIISALQSDPRATAVLCGSALKNRGIQPLLDAVVRYLPAPVGGQRVRGREGVLLEPVQPGDQLTALAYKVVSDRQKGPITFVRVYGGKLRAKQEVKVVSPEGSVYEQKVSNLVRARADELSIIQEIGPGDIAAVLGFKRARSGDSVIEGSSPDRWLDGLAMPPAVFFCAIEAKESKDQKRLKEILADLTREDPSLRFREDEETGQSIISGMGELHIEILRDRIALEHGINAELGRMRVSYRESFNDAAEASLCLDKEYHGKKLFAEVKLRVEPMEEASGLESQTSPAAANRERELGQNEILFDFEKLAPVSQKIELEQSEARKYKRGAKETFEFRKSLDSLSQQMKHVIHQTISDFLTSGPALGYPLVRVRVRVLDGRWNSLRSSEMAFRLCIVDCLKQLAQEAGSRILEPFVTTDIFCPESAVGFILNDVTSVRRGNIVEVGLAPGRSEKRVVKAVVPLSEMVGYSSQLRALTRGTGSFHTVFSHYAYVGPDRQAQILSFGGLF